MTTAAPTLPYYPAVLPRPRSNRAGLLATIGPALLVSAGYLDPGNWGTDVAAGAQAGHRLIWVLGAATLAALFLQQLAGRLGAVSGHDLAQLMRARLPLPVRRILMPGILAALAVTEVVEVFGVVIAIQLLTGWSAVAATGPAALLVIALVLAPPGTGRRSVYCCLGLIGAVYLALLAFRGGGEVLAGLRPSGMPARDLPIAIGMIGAVVMPHNVLLHASLARDLARQAPAEALRRLLRSSAISTAVALALAFAVNCAIVVLAAQLAPGGNGISVTFDRLHASYGRAAALLFASTLLAAGLASSVTGSIASADVLTQFHPGLAVPAAARRLACLIPAVILAVSGLPVITVLVWSQVLLTLALPLVVLPLLWFTSQRSVMGAHTVGPLTATVGIALTAAVMVAGGMSLV
jgi:manganese transport protein